VSFSRLRSGEARPLVTGEAALSGAVGLLVLSAALAAACAVGLPGAAAFMVIATFALVNFYNLWGKRGQAPVAMGVMGLCRMANFGIGVAAAIGVPLDVDLRMLGPTGPLWVRHGLAIAFTSAMVTGYSLSVRRGYAVSTRPWQVLLVTVFVGLGMWMIGVPAFASAMRGQGRPTRLVPPLARAVALVALALLWPGRLWSGAGPQRKPAEYAPFIERALYWLVLLDAAFVVDGLMLEDAVT
jgi:4-hydroxybenzoate polyprenyltransferase